MTYHATHAAVSYSRAIEFARKRGMNACLTLDGLVITVGHFHAGEPDGYFEVPEVLPVDEWGQVERRHLAVALGYC